MISKEKIFDLDIFFLPDLKLLVELNDFVGKLGELG